MNNIDLLKLLIYAAEIPDYTLKAVDVEISLSAVFGQVGTLTSNGNIRVENIVAGYDIYNHGYLIGQLIYNGPKPEPESELADVLVRITLALADHDRPMR